MEITEYLLVIGSSMIKLVAGLIIAVGAKMSFFETYFTVSGGGILGVTIYAFFGTKIRFWITKWQNKRRKGPKKINYKRLRFYIRVWRRYGLAGIAFLTPPLLSPPIGTLIAVSMGESVRRILIYMTISILLWGLIFAGFSNVILNIASKVGVH